MSLARQLKRKQQLQEIRYSYCRKCGSRLKVRKGKVVCEKCNIDYGKVSDRV
nr:MAG TPA: ribosome, girodazole, girolline, antibiotic complex, 50S [Caudoviricetes sp.]